MGKKKSSPRLSEAQLYRPGMDSASNRAMQGDEQDLADEYQYVVADLKRIGFLALVMLALLVVLAFVLV